MRASRAHANGRRPMIESPAVLFSSRREAALPPGRVGQ
jgi:hypothetical protein